MSQPRARLVGLLASRLFSSPTSLMTPTSIRYSLARPSVWQLTSISGRSTEKWSRTYLGAARTFESQTPLCLRMAATRWASTKFLKERHLCAGSSGRTGGLNHLWGEKTSKGQASGPGWRPRFRLSRTASAFRLAQASKRLAQW